MITSTLEGRQPRRVQTAKRRLCMGGIGQSESTNAAITPRLALQPSERVETVLGLAQVFRETAARMIADAAILISDGIAVPNKISGDRGLASAAVHSDRLAADLS